MTKIYRIPTGQVEGNGSNETNTGEIRPYGEIGLFIGDNNKLELLMFDGIRTHVRSKILNKGTFYGGDADSADGAGYDSIKLVPDEELRRGGSQQYIIVEPTGGEPGHVHIRAGGAIDNSSADLFLGGELNHVRISDTNNSVKISTDAGEGTYTWAFDNGGNLTFPGEGSIKPTVGNLNISVGTTTLADLENNYIGQLALLDAIFAQETLTPGYPWGITLPVSYETYNEMIQLSPGTIPSQVFITTTAKSVSDAWDYWQEALNEERLMVNIGSKTWQFRGDSIIKFPGNALVDSADSNIEFRGMNNFNVEAVDAVNIITNSSGNAYSWQFGDDGRLTLPSSDMSLCEIIREGYLVLSSSSVGDDGMSAAVLAAGNVGAVILRTNDGTDYRDWAFYSDGKVDFPDNRIKYATGADFSIETAIQPTEPPTTMVISGADFVAVNLTYTKDGANSIWYPAGYNPATDPYIEFTGGQWGIFVPGFGQALYVNVGSLNVPFAQWNTNPPLGSVAPTGVYTYPNTYNHVWTFGDTGTLTVPGNIAKTSGNLEITAENYVIIDSTNGGQIDIGANQADGTPNSATILVGHAGNTLQIAAGKLRINATTPPTHSYGAVGDVAGLIAFSSGYLYYCTGSYVAPTYPSETFTVSNAGQFSNTIKVLVADNPNYTVPQAGWTVTIGTTLMTLTAFSALDIDGVTWNFLFDNTPDAVLPSTVTLTSPTPNSPTNIWKRVAWSGDTW